MPPQAAPISKIKNQYRFRIILKIDTIERIKPTLERIIDLYGGNNSGIYLSIDVNPVNMY